jgi:hypothetical protein
VKCNGWESGAIMRLELFEIEVGRMDHWFEMNGILGMNFFIAADAIIYLEKLEIHFSE